MTSALPHVVHVIDELPPDGAERLLTDVLRHRSKEYRFSVVCLIKGGTLAAEIQDMGVPVVVLGRRHKFDPGLVYRLVAWLRQHQAAVVHTHLFTADSYGRVAARLAGVRAVFSTVHTNICVGIPRRTIQWMLSWASTRVIACSDEVGRVLTKELHLPRSRVEVIANGIDIDRFAGARGDGVRAEFGIAADSLLIGVVGRLHPAKGHSDLLEAAAALCAEGLNPTCLFVGSGELEGELRDQTERLGLKGRIVFAGQRRDVPRLLAALDVLAMPSRWEGLPMALLEGMAMSKPLVATRVGGIPDVIEHDVNGLLVPPADPKSLTSALRGLLRDADLRARLGKAACATLRERYDVARTAQAYESLYAAALSR